MDEQQLTAPDGWPLVARVLPGRGRGVVVVLHAMMADARSLDRPRGAGFGSTLAAAGWEVWLCDHRGHGRSGPLAKDGGSWTYDDLVLRDVPTFLRAARARTSGPVVVVGHSLGGHVSAASLAMGIAEADAWVGVAANVWLPQDEPRAPVRWVKSAAAAAFDGVAKVYGRFPVQRLGMGNTDEPAAYVEATARFWRTGRWGTQDGTVDWSALTPGLTLPCLSVLGCGDLLLARPDAAAAWASRLGRGAQVWLVGEGRYGVEGAPGHMELMTDARCAGWWRELAGWLEAVF